MTCFGGELLIFWGDRLEASPGITNGHALNRRLVIFQGSAALSDSINLRTCGIIWRQSVCGQNHAPVCGCWCTTFSIFQSTPSAPLLVTEPSIIYGSPLDLNRERYEYAIE